ncbi:hypothetical protein KY332_01920 [Candidatus Woesearchaeota archaeon]|nr:hypothetical protein [Candidatus Woesearchaeota archaeon]
MTGAGYGKKLLRGAKVYIHEKGKSLARITHIDIEHPDIGKIIKPGESSYVGGKRGGCFIGLKKDMIKRAERILKKKS